jgi:NAD(P)-dependent dehydrogenase (short-subunit alcohol dehydrogenase family)
VTRSHVVTGVGRGIGRAIAERLLRDGEAVVLLERVPDESGWVARHPAGRRIAMVTGSAADPAVAERAADAAQERAPCTAGSTMPPSSAAPPSTPIPERRSWP